ncbi:MAG: protein phosphatase 2C domain-containing protein [Bdellovibrionota bacterium]
MVVVNPGATNDARSKRSDSSSDLRDLYRTHSLDDLIKVVKKYAVILRDAGQVTRAPVNAPRISEQDLKYRSLAYAQLALDKARNAGRISSESISDFEPLNLDDLNVKVTRAKGRAHMLRDEHCQDQAVVVRNHDYLVAVQADGVSTTRFAAIGALIQSHITTEAIFESLNSVQVEEGQSLLLCPDFLASVYTIFYTKLFEVAKKCDLHIEDALELFITATNKILIVSPKESVVYSIDDGFLSFNGAYLNVAEHVGRLKILSDLNIGPSIKYAIREDDASKIGHRSIPRVFDPNYTIEGLKQSYTHAELINFNRVVSEILVEEARGFQVMAWAPSAEFFSSPVSLFTDGVSFAQELNQESDNKFFPLVEWAEKYSQATLEYYTALFNLSELVVNKGSLIPLIKFILKFDSVNIVEDERKMANPVREKFTDAACNFIIPYEQFIPGKVNSKLAIGQRALHVLDQLEKQGLTEHLTRIKISLSQGARRAILKLFAWKEEDKFETVFDDFCVVSLSKKTSKSGE